MYYCGIDLAKHCHKLSVLDEAVETITKLQSQVVVLNEQVDSLQAEVKELKARLDQNSKNSNKPLSADGFR